MLELDHVIYGTADLDAAAAHFAAEYGLETSIDTGRHPGGTTNRVIPVGGTQYIELLAPDGPGPVGEWVRRLTSGGDRWLMWAVVTDDLEGHAARLGLEVVGGEITTGSGTVSKWMNAGVGERAVTRGRVPFFIDYSDPEEQRRASWAARLAEVHHLVGVHGFAWLEVGTDRAELDHWLDGAELPVRSSEGEGEGLRRVALTTDNGEVVLS